MPALSLDCCARYCGHSEEQPLCGSERISAGYTRLYHEEEPRIKARSTDCEDLSAISSFRPERNLELRLRLKDESCIRKCAHKNSFSNKITQHSRSCGEHLPQPVCQPAAALNRWRSGIPAGA